MRDSRSLLKLCWSLLPLVLAAALPAHAADSILAAPVFYGASTCGSTACHGGATAKSCQLTVWSQRDVHSRSYATLTNARSARMAEALQIPNAAQSSRCTICHAPLADVPALITSDASSPPATRATESVSCVSCHGPAGDWLRTHPRLDYTHAERVAAGLKDLHSAYVRAGTCVACHQNIDPELVARARHPELIFELDGQSASQPKHWQELPGWSGAQNWYVGQLVALREVSWALAQKTADTERETPRQHALAWLTARAAGATASVSTEDFSAAVAAADALAKTASNETWTPARALETLRRLAATATDFRDAKVSQPEQARRAEALVLAFDRLIVAQPVAARTTLNPANAELEKLFTLAQSRPDFTPAKFAEGLEALVAALPPAGS